jgi:hypothetical protein
LETTWLVENCDGLDEGIEMSDVPGWFRRLFADWSTNAAAGRASSPYRDVGPGPVSVGGGAAPTIYGNGGLPSDVVERGRQTMREQMPQYSGGQITPYQEPQAGQMAPNPPPGAGQIAPPARRYPGYDYAAFDRAIAPHVGAAEPQSGVREGQNANIDDETRLRALQWVLSQGK